MCVIFVGTVFNDDFEITGNSYVEPKDELCETSGICSQGYYAGMVVGYGKLHMLINRVV